MQNKQIDKNCWTYGLSPCVRPSTACQASAPPDVLNGTLIAWREAHLAALFKGSTSLPDQRKASRKGGLGRL